MGAIDQKDRADVELTLGGAFAVRLDNGAPVEGLSRRGQALLAYLSQCPSMRAERTALADLLWSDRGETQARASLRQVLSELRRRLPAELIEANRQCVWLDPARVRVVHGAGIPLDGFDLASEGFEDWLRTLRSGRSPTAGQDEHAEIFERPAVLLLAFDALSDQSQDGMIATGLSDDLRTTLCYWRWFPVIGPDAIGWRTARETDLRATAAEVGAVYVVSGRLARSGARVRVAVTLTEAETGHAIWSRTFEGALDDVFAFQEEVSRAIVAQIEPEIARAEAARITRTRPSDLAPWQLLAMADEAERHAGEGYGTPESNLAQVDLMERAIAAGPDFAPAHARLARVWFRFALLGWSEDPASSFATSIACSEKALAIDPDNAEAHAYNGLARIFGPREYETGLFHAREAVRCNPSAAIARHALGCALEWMGSPEEALTHNRLILRLNPAYPGRAAVLGQITTCEVFIGDRDRALEAARKLVAIAPDYARGLQRAVATFGNFGAEQEAKAALSRLRALQPDFDEDYVRRTYPYALAENLETLITGLRKAGAF